MSSISELSGIASYETYANQVKAKSTELGKDEFLKLLVTQLQYQDPLEPMSDSDFVAQLAQFSSLEQMSNLTTLMTTSQAFDLVGKYVYAEVTTDSGEKLAISGLVDRVVIQDGVAMAQIGDYLVNVSAISQVIDKDLVLGENPLISNTNLIGKTVSAYKLDGEGVKTTVSGVVTRVAITDDGSMVAYLDTEEKIDIGNIFDIKE